jgi:hypothetical protein
MDSNLLDHDAGGLFDGTGTNATLVYQCMFINEVGITMLNRLNLGGTTELSLVGDGEVD